MLFHKGAQLYGAIPGLLEAGAVPVLVEGPIDALAVTLAGHGRYVGVAPLGNRPHRRAGPPARHAEHPTRSSPPTPTCAGRVAAERAFWLLAQHGTDPLAVDLPDGADPASVLHAHGPDALLELLDNARPLGQVMIDERLTNLPARVAIEAATRVIAARPPSTWVGHTAGIAERLGIDMRHRHGHLRTAVTEWNRDPARAAARHLDEISEVRTRLEATVDDAPARWVALADQIDRRLTAQSDWPALAEMLQDANDAGHDVTALTQRLVADSPLGEMPAQELRYRLVVWLPEPNPFEREEAATKTTSRRDVLQVPTAPARITTRSVR